MWVSGSSSPPAFPLPTFPRTRGSLVLFPHPALFQRLKPQWVRRGRLNGVRQPVGVGVMSNNERVALRAARRLLSVETLCHSQEVWFNPGEDNSILYPEWTVPLTILFSVLPWEALPVIIRCTLFALLAELYKIGGWFIRHPTSFSLKRLLKEDLRTCCPNRRCLDCGPAVPSAGFVGGEKTAVQSKEPLLILKEHEPYRWHKDSVPPSTLRPLFWSLSWSSLRQRD